MVGVEATYHAQYPLCPFCLSPYASDIDDMLMGKIKWPGKGKKRAYTMQEICEFAESKSGKSYYPSQLSRHKNKHLLPEVDKLSALRKQMDHLFGSEASRRAELSDLKSALIKQAVLILMSFKQEDLIEMQIEDRITFSLKLSDLAVELERMGNAEIGNQLRQMVEEIAEKKKVATINPGELIKDHLDRLGDEDGKAEPVPIPTKVAA